MEAKDILELFVAPQNDPRGLDKPYRLDGFLYATNGHICIRIENDESIAVGDQFNPQKIARILSTEFGTEYKPLEVNLPPAKVCQACGGAGGAYECQECAGDGWFEHGKHDYDCKECDGNGVVDEGEKQIECPFCDGHGDELNQPVKLGNTHFNRRYLAILQKLDGIELQCNSGETDVALFRFKGGVGAIMPTRT